MKKVTQFLFVIFFIFVKIVFADNVTFEWNPNLESDLAGYRLYQSGISGSYTYGTTSPNFVGEITAPFTTYTQSTVAEGTWYWVLTAFNTSNLESGPSNEASLTTGPLDVPVPVNFKVSFSVGIVYAIQGTPLNLMNAAIPENGQVILTLNNIPPNATTVGIILRVYDPDQTNEGRLFVNGQGPIQLFGSDGVDINDATTVILNAIDTNIAWYQIGQNTLTFWHDSTAGYVIEEITINFK
jgi:hypothetical protein